jgi:hypothetical protein
MTGTVALACFIVGFITGWFLRTVLVMAEISRSQERMENKIRYWQSETLYARHRAERLAHRLRALGHSPGDADDDPPQDRPRGQL